MKVSIGRGGVAKPSAMGPMSSKVIQRAITIGMNPIPRTVHTPTNIVTFLQQQGLYSEFVKLNDEREVIYLFDNDQHLVDYLKLQTGQIAPGSVSAPIKQKVNADQLKQGHEFASDIRFTTIYQPGGSQIPDTAPGAHNIPNQMMPPPGQHHQWGQMPYPSVSGQEYVLYQHQFHSSANTVPLTFGDPNAPSMVMNQGGLNLGMHIQPTSNSNYLNPITRSQTNYAGLPSVSDRVRGHPFELKQNQISTDDADMDFDQDSRTYTDESDSTKTNGGISSWRYNQIEKVATANGMPFTQVNNNSVKSSMGIARPDTIDFRIQQSSGGYKDLQMDNTATTDYRETDSVRGTMAKQAYQTEMGRQQALLHPYQAPPVRRPGEDFTDTNRHSYPGYMSPPPTPFLSDDTLATSPEPIILGGFPAVGSRVNMPNGSKGVVVEVIDRDKNRKKSRCMVKAILSVQWPGSFGI
ncbi:hypothetical protein [Spirosoma oryzae]|nr:hypothetical protein [Spirosoma oryzae]